MSKDNNVISFDRLPHAFQKLSPFVEKAVKAEQDTLRAPTKEVDLIVQFAFKKYNMERLKPKQHTFTNTFTEAALSIGEHKNYAHLSSEEKTAIRVDLMAQGQVLDALCELSSNERHDGSVMRMAMAKAMGSYLYMIHNGNMEHITSDLKQSMIVAEAAAKEFGSSVKGWETLMEQKGGEDGK